jgi:hypothetical protein
MVASLTVSEPPCAYVVGQVGGVTVATPALAVFVPPREAGVQPLRVHLDEAGERLLGYSTRPGEGAGPDTGRVFVQGRPEAGATFTPLPELGGRLRTCSSLGVSTPAVLVPVPTSVLEDFPHALTEVPNLAFNLHDTTVRVPAHVLSLEGHTLLLPLQGATPEPVLYDIPRQSILLGPSGAGGTARYLAPPAK